MARIDFKKESPSLLKRIKDRFNIHNINTILLIIIIILLLRK